LVEGEEEGVVVDELEEVGQEEGQAIQEEKNPR